MKTLALLALSVALRAESLPVSISAGIAGTYAGSLGYHPRPEAFVEVDTHRLWTLVKIAPLAKTSVDGGIEYGGRAAVGVVPLVRSAWLTGVIAADRMTSSVWSKTTLGVGAGIHATSGPVEIQGQMVKNYVAPNGGWSADVRVTVHRRRFVFGFTSGFARFSQPFETPALRLSGSSVGGFVGIKL